MPSFFNAKVGLKRIYKAEIVTIITSIILLACTACVALSVVFKNQSKELDALAGISVILILLCALVLVIVYFVNITGILRAKEDNSSYGKAMWCIILSIVIVIAVSVVRSIYKVDYSEYTDVIVSVLNTLTTVFIIKATNELLAKRNQMEAIKFGEDAYKIIVIPYVISIVINIIDFFVKKDTIVSTGLDIISSIVALVGYFMYLAFLKKAVGRLVD